MEQSKIIDTLETYQIPATFKGKSFATLDMDKLASHTAKIDICIGNNDEERSDIILDLVNREKMKCLQFADANPEIVLPDSLDSAFGTATFPSDSTTVLISKSGGTADLELDSHMLLVSYVGYSPKRKG